MCVEQNRLGLRVKVGVVYKVKTGRIRAEGDARCPKKGAGSLLAQVCAFPWAFIAMKLGDGLGDLSESFGNFPCAMVHKQQHGRHKRRQAFCKFSSPGWTHATLAGRVKHKTNGVDPCRYGGVNILLTGEAAQFDSGANCLGNGSAHGNQSYAGVRSGMP